MSTHLSSSCARVDADGTLPPSIAEHPGVEISATLNGSNGRMEISRIGMKKSRMEMTRMEISYSVHGVPLTKQEMTSSLEGAKSLWANYPQCEMGVTLSRIFTPHVCMLLSMSYY